MRPLSFAEYLRTPELSGAEWQKETRAPWHAVAKALSGEQLDRTELRLFRAATGLTRVPRNLRVIIGLIGRRGGKSHFLAAFAVWVAVFAADWPAMLSPGERGVVLLLATAKKTAAILARYAAAICQRPLIAPEVRRLTADEIEFANGAVIEVGISDYRSVRGRTCLAVIFDEACFAAEEGVSPLEEVIAAAEPAMATVPGRGWLLLSSSPWKPAGLMHKRWRDLHGHQDVADKAAAICWVASSTTMNPMLPQSYVDEKVAQDPLRARSEYVVDPSAPWRSTDADFVPDDAIQTCTDWGVRERAPIKGRKYFAFADPASGSGTDSFCLGIAHADGDQVILDCLRERKPRFAPAAVVTEFSETLRLYGLNAVTGDHWAKGFVKDEFERNGIQYRPSKRTRSEVYLAGLPLLLSSRARLLDHKGLRTQLAGLERQVRAGGRETVDHGSSSGSHDDAANVAIGALVLAADLRRYAPAPIIGTYGTRVERPLCAAELPPPAWVRNPANESQAVQAAAYLGQRARA
jgi:hypothetical protein